MKIKVGLAILAFVFMAGLSAPFLNFLPSPTAQNLEKEFSPSEPGHPLGFGENGVDVLSQLIWSARSSLALSFSSVLVALTIGIGVGFFAGWYQGWTDFFLLRVIELFESFPGILLVVGIAAFLGPHPAHVFLVLVFNSWIGFAKMSRILVNRLKNQDFIVAGRAIGLGKTGLLLKYFLPSMRTEMAVLAAQAMGSALVVESSLNFLGLGFPPGTPSWGAMLNQAREVIVSAPQIIFYPASALMLCIFSFQLVADGVRTTK